MKKYDSASFGKIPFRSKCTRCKARAVVHLPSHHANFCESCFLHFFRTAVRRALKLFPLNRNLPLMIAVSGGKDSLAVWSILDDLGYKTKGIHINLGIDGFSSESISAIEKFARSRSLPYAIYELKELLGVTLPELYKKARRTICSLCGTIKRQLLNRIAYSEGFKLVVTGHNLDDEASRLLGNIIRHKEQYLEKMYPYLPPIGDKIPAKIKPLFRVESEEIRIYCKIKNIEYFSGVCPFSKGATSHIFLEALNLLEAKMPGTKRDFLFNHVKHSKPPETEKDYLICKKCGFPSYTEICSFCNLKSKILEDKQSA